MEWQPEPREKDNLSQSMHSKENGIVRRLYDWVIHWGDTPYGTPALAGISFAESSVFPVPPDPLLICLCLGEKARPLRLAAICTGASVSGGIFGYIIGAWFWTMTSSFFFEFVPGFTSEGFLEVGTLYNSWGFLAVFLAGLTPIPYKVFTISAGVFGINFPLFVLASFLGRSLRFFILAGLIVVFGPSIKDFIDRYFNLLVWLFSALLVLGFLSIAFI